METQLKTKPKQPDPLDPAIVLTYADLDVIGRLLSKHITSQEELFKAIQSASHLSVEGVQVKLEPRLLMRLKTRCLDKPNWPSWLAGIVKMQLHDYAGY